MCGAVCEKALQPAGWHRHRLWTESKHSQTEADVSRESVSKEAGFEATLLYGEAYIHEHMIV